MNFIKAATGQQKDYGHPRTESHGSKAFLDEKGNLVLPPEMLQHLGVTSPAEFIVTPTAQGLWLQKAVPSLTKVYVEPTSRCNLNCRTCIRNSWDEPAGTMEMETYRKLVSDLAEVPSLRQINFWGFGEPLLHPGIAEMVSLAKELGVKTEIVTNALLLDQAKAESLVSAGLDSIVVSVDGTTTEANASIRSGADLNLVKKHIHQLRDIRQRSSRGNPEIGIEFVLMRRNLEELPGLRRLAFSLGASFIIITNLLPYTEELKDDILYLNSIDYVNSSDKVNSSERSVWFPEIILPPLDFRPEISRMLARILDGPSIFRTSLPQVKINEGDGYCRFIAEGSAVVAWDGAVSPCVPLMHSYTCYVMGRKKLIKRYTIGNVNTEKIKNIMENSEFAIFRDRVQRFDFSPCAHCGGCELADSNEEDCFGNTFPVCGDCLWARGVIQCP